MNNNKRRKLATIAGISLMIIGGSFAYFTDSATYTANGTAGTLNLTVTPGANELTNFAPGDFRKINFNVKNDGTLAMDTRITFYIENADGGPAISDGTFSIYKASEVLDGEGKLKADLTGITPVAAKVNTAATVSLGVLNGSQETVPAAAGLNTVNGEYVVVFDKLARNELQGVELKFQALIEARQYTNAHELDWAELTSAEISFGGDEAYKTVPSVN